MDYTSFQHLFVRLPVLVGKHITVSAVVDLSAASDRQSVLFLPLDSVRKVLVSGTNLITDLARRVEEIKTEITTKCFDNRNAPAISYLISKTSFVTKYLLDTSWIGFTSNCQVSHLT